MPESARPQVTHQSGEKHVQELEQAYARAGVQARVLPFIEDMATAYAEADLVICRAGASTVAELTAAGVSALLVPFPHAVDDHQTTNARFLSERDAGWLMPQNELNPERLRDWLLQIDRDQLLDHAQRAWALRQTDAVERVVQACEELLP